MSETQSQDASDVGDSPEERALDYLRKLESEPIHEGALSIVNEVVRILTKWPTRDIGIEPKCLRLLRRYREQCSVVSEYATQWSEHTDVHRRKWAASILPAIDPSHPKVIEWIEQPESSSLQNEPSCDVLELRMRAIDALLNSWPKAKILKDRLLAISRHEQDVYLAADLLCLEPSCQQTARNYLECVGRQIPYHERYHEVLDASYTYLRTKWPASDKHSQVIDALRKQSSLVMETLTPWIRLTKFDTYQATAHQTIAACRILFELGYAGEPIALALAAVLSRLQQFKDCSADRGHFVSDYCKIAALELLDAMGPRAVASLPLIHRFADDYRSWPIAECVIKTVASIGSSSKESLDVIVKVLQLDPEGEHECEWALKTFKLAGKVLSTLFSVDGKFAELIDGAVCSQSSRTQFARFLSYCDLNSIAMEVELFLTSTQNPNTNS